MYLIKFAFRNLKANKRIYMPYIIAGIVSVLIFFVIAFIGLNKSVLDTIQSATFEKILRVGIAFSILVIFCFMYLANGYLIKNKKSFFGVCNTLGMSKNQIVAVTFWETVFIAAISLVIGMIVGIGFAYGLSYAVVRLLNAEETISITLTAQIPRLTAIVFGIIYLALFVLNAVMIFGTKTIELIKGKQIGDKEVKGAELRSVTGIITLLAGYGICFFTRSPISAFMMIIISVVLIIYGIYMIFQYSSVKALKGLKDKEKVYYKTDNFICVSNLLYRIKKNAVGLATICVLSTAVIIILTTTISLYAGIRDQVNGMFVKDISASVVDVDAESREAYDSFMKEIIEKNGLSENEYYRFISFSGDAKIDGNRIECSSAVNLISPDYAYVSFVNIDDYNNVLNKNIELSPDEVLVITNKKGFDHDRIYLGDTEYKVVGVLPPKESIEGGSGQITTCFEVVSGDAGKVYQEAYRGVNENLLGRCDVKYYLDATDTALQNNLVSEISHFINGNDYKGSCSGYEETYSFYLSFYAGALFIGIGLSILFIIMTGYIIYYKQVSDSFEDRDKFLMMEKIGLTKQEIKRAAGKQMVITFLAPVFFTVINVLFVSKIVYKFLGILNMSNFALFVLCVGISVLIYAVIYIVLYFVTTQIYTKNVSEKYRGI